jgi:hypothetical protein
MDIESLKQILNNRVANAEENMRISQQIGNLEEAVRLEQEVEETKLTLSQL